MNRTRIAAAIAAVVVAAGYALAPADLLDDTRTDAEIGDEVATLVSLGYRIPVDARPPESKRTEAIVMAVPLAAADAFDAQWPAIYCASIRNAELRASCEAAQAGSRSTALCVGGSVVGHVVRIQGTPALASRAQALAAHGVTLGEPPVEWVSCE